MRRGEVWWANLPDPAGSSPGYRRPVLVIQSERVTASSIRTVIIAAITKNLRLAEADGNVLLLTRQSSLPFDSVVNVSQLLTVDKTLLAEYVGDLPLRKMHQVDDGLRLILTL